MATIVWEHSPKRRGDKFSWRQLVLLREQNNNLAVDEPFRVDDRLKKYELLDHSVLGAVFKKDGIVARDVTCEDNSIHILERPDPFLPLAPDAAQIEKMVDSVVVNESCLKYTSGLRSAVKYILDAGNIVWIQDTIQCVSIAALPSANVCRCVFQRYYYLCRIYLLIGIIHDVVQGIQHGFLEHLIELCFSP